MVAERGGMQRFLRAGALTWLLAAVCGWALLLWLAALLGMGARVETASPPPAAALPPPAPHTPDRIGPLAQYAEAATRPLFTQDRRPRAFVATSPDEDGAGANSASLDFLLTGVLISPQVRMAILQPSAGGESQRVREGTAPEGAAGWRLLEVQPRRAIFEGAGGQMTLELRTFGAAAAPPPERRDAVPGAAASGAADAAADAAQAATDAAAAEQPVDLDDIRRRIEARRAQLQQPPNSNTGSLPTRPLSGPAR